MGHLMIFLILVCSMLIVTPIVTEGNTVGVTYGRMSSQILLPSVVSEMLMANGVKRVKLFSFYRGVVPAFSNTGVEMMITIPTLELDQIYEQDRADAYAVVNITKAYKQYDLNVKYFMVANEPYTLVDNYTTLYQNQFHLALEYISKSIKKQPEPYNQIKASIPHAMDVLIPKILKPSDADFNEIFKERMLSTLKTLDANEAPFVVNIYPHLTLVEKGYPLEFGFFDNVGSGFKIIDGPRVYTNVFDFVYDSFVWALKKHGYDKMEVLVSQVGWPTDGHFYANISTAQRFYNGFLKKIANDEGTPLRPWPINVYLNNINDENNRDMKLRGPTVRHYGIYDYKGVPKFQLDFSLKGRKDVELVSANGVVSMPRRWCVYDNSTMGKNSTQQVMEQFEYACSKADCSKLFYGSSYNNFTFEGNISYAFNNYFQSRNQAENECDFKGLGKIQQQDPSLQYGGNFPLQFLSTTFGWGKSEMGLTLAQKGTNVLVYSAAGRLGMAYGLTLLVPLLSLFFLGIYV